MSFIAHTGFANLRLYTRHMGNFAIKMEWIACELTCDRRNIESHGVHAERRRRRHHKTNEQIKKKRNYEFVYGEP